ncbi:MAG: sigma-70 family RNA polymerase sigma factor [Chloroflexi bacterium]|nr:sigma-70 family RNA polymerase sigma factor [Chloroflexota bacterium]
MSWDDESLAAALQHAVQLVAAQKGEPIARTIAPIVMANLDRGRVHYFLDGHEDAHPEAYVWRVFAFYEKWQPYLYQIQEERCAEYWLPLYEKLKRWAYNYLSSKNYFATPAQKLELATDCAAMAATRLLNARFPYDTDFDPWVYMLLQNVMLKSLHREYKEYREEVARVQNVDDWEEWESLLPHLSTKGERDRAELRQALSSAIEQLASDARKQIILLHYIEGMSLQQIAREMGRSDSAIHKLHFDALNNLRKIWGSSWDKYE